MEEKLAKPVTTAGRIIVFWEREQKHILELNESSLEKSFEKSNMYFSVMSQLCQPEDKPPATDEQIKI